MVKRLYLSHAKPKKMSLVGFGFGLSLETHRKYVLVRNHQFSVLYELHRQKFFRSVITLRKKKQKQKKKNKKQLVLKAEKKYEDRGENVTLM